MHVLQPLNRDIRIGPDIGEVLELGADRWFDEIKVLLPLSGLEQADKCVDGVVLQPFRGILEIRCEGVFNIEVVPSGDFALDIDVRAGKGTISMQAPEGPLIDPQPECLRLLLWSSGKDRRNSQKGYDGAPESSRLKPHPQHLHLVHINASHPFSECCISVLAELCLDSYGVAVCFPIFTGAFHRMNVQRLAAMLIYEPQYCLLPNAKHFHQ